MIPAFFNELDADIKETLRAQLRNLWTHHSTALEGNSLNLGETAFVIEEGLTVSGKPLKDHQEVQGHARAIELLYTLLAKSDFITETDLFQLHQAVQTQVLVDVYNPVGAWKKEPNGTYTVTAEGKQKFIEFAKPSDVQALMTQWLADFNQRIKNVSSDAADVARHYAYIHVSFVRIHPFFDGNGRMARLLANLPVLRAGLPPIVIPTERRMEYIRLLGAYELAVGQVQIDQSLLPQPEKLDAFVNFCGEVWRLSLDLIDEAKKQQASRKS